MLARFGRVILPNPGGDRIGRRPVDLHVTALEQLGATIEYRKGYYYASAPPNGLRGAHIEFPIVTVMGTENVLLAATLARGTTTIDNAALEPEIDDLIAMLRGMGAHIERDGERRISVEGVERLGGVEHRVMGDRLEAETFAIAAAITGGTVTLHGVDPAHLAAFLEVAERVGLDLVADAAEATIRVQPHREPLRATDVETAPYPGFATDYQAPLSVLLTQAAGNVHHPRDDLRGPHGPHPRAGADGGRRRAARRAARPHHRADAAPRGRGRHRRPARRRHPHPRRAVAPQEPR